ncbi:hypothetical protein MCAG_00312 [Micromonospora sp. ATCC 39149]|uniref:Uncharacterized protein n=1 Tax=Micromonospora carbonacea TaxID=47853 RepID=A0A7D6CFF6_9ACTN|nr:hypothetical protein [Micromonospora sp. ATCC 39149]EEP69985.1 hypothetical protein MCAG_00312 [Micromonospora sp. ATCC 39149]QLJ96431.1 hypothetical protein HZU44_15795 [Micromonospora carbonacea]
MSRHDEPNEYGFAGGATAPQPPPGGRPDEQDLAQEVAVPGDDLTESFSDAVSEETEPAEEDEPAERRP